MLKLLHVSGSRSNLKFVRLDGTSNQQQREKIISQFTEDENILVCHHIIDSVASFLVFCFNFFLSVYCFRYY